MTTNAVKVLVDATIIAMGSILDDRGIAHDHGAMADAIKQVVKESLDDMMAEWKDAVEVNLGEAWLRELVNAQAWELALKAVEVYCEVPTWQECLELLIEEFTPVEYAIPPWREGDGWCTGGW